MSVRALTCAMALRGVSPSEKLLLLALANYADEHMRCWPSQRRLAEETCLSDRTIRTLLSGLEERNVISRTERSRPDGSRASDIITLNLGAEMVSVPPEVISGGAEAASGGVRKQLPGAPEMVSALTTFEPSIDPSNEPSSSVARGAPRAKKGSRRCPERWEPSPRTYAQLVEEGFVVGDLERALTRMRDHEFKTARTDWDAAFRNWVRRDADNKPSPRNDRPHHEQRQSAREDSLRNMHAGAMAALNRRLG